MTSMSLPRGMTINIHGQDDSFWCVHGPGAGTQGVTLGKDQVQGLFSAPVRTAWAAGARSDGGVMKGKWHDWRDLALGFNITSQGVRRGSQQDIASRFREAFGYREDEWDHDAHLAKIEVITPSTTRWLYVQMYENEDFDPGIDPLLVQYENPIIPLRAGQPFWEEEDLVYEWSTDKSSDSGEILVHNPTHQPMKQEWVVTRGDWILPDVSWEGKKWNRRPGVSKATGRDDRNRAIPLPTIGALEGIGRVSLDTTRKLMIRDAADTNLLGRMPIPGMRFRYVIPPCTQEQTLPVSVMDAPAGGAKVKIYLPRRYEHPYGTK